MSVRFSSSRTGKTGPQPLPPDEQRQLKQAVEMMEIAARLPHSHRHDYDRDETISKTASLRDTHSEDKFTFSDPSVSQGDRIRDFEFRDRRYHRLPSAIVK